MYRQRHGLTSTSVTWRRVLDVNDRALREVVVGLGGAVDGTPRQTGFDITPASEVMAVLSLARDLEDLRARLGRIVIGTNADGEPVTAEDLRAAGAMAALLREAAEPNLLATGEGTPVLVHAGPFGNLSVGTNSVIADRIALSTADVVVTEAGFGADLGAEKFLHLKVPEVGRPPDVIVLVTTVQAMRWHGGSSDYKKPDVEAVVRGCANLRQVTGKEAIREGVEIRARDWYGALRVDWAPDADKMLGWLEAYGFGHLPVCVAKTHLSVSHDPDLRGAPIGFEFPVRELRLAAGGGYVTALAGTVMTMPGLPAAPRMWDIDLDADGNVTGLV